MRDRAAEPGAHSEPLPAVRAHLEAFNTRDLDAVVATFAEDAVFAAGEQLVVGRRALRVMFADAFAAPVRARLELQRAVTQGDTAACELTETLEVGGVAHRLDVAVFFSACDSRLSRVKVYRDLSEPSERR